jgi:hypothetical protein
MRIRHFAAPLGIGLKSNRGIIDFSVYGIESKQGRGFGKAVEHEPLTIFALSDTVPVSEMTAR